MVVNEAVLDLHRLLLRSSLKVNEPLRQCFTEVLLKGITVEDRPLFSQVLILMNMSADSIVPLMYSEVMAGT